MLKAIIFLQNLTQKKLTYQKSKKQVEVAGTKFVVTNNPNFEKVKELKLPVVLLGEELIEGSMNWYKLLEAADRAGTIYVKEDIKQTDLCALPFSSGITGVSKGVMLTHRNLVANLCSTLSGVPPEMVAKVKDPIVEEFDLSSLKLEAIMTAAAPLAPELQTAFENKFPGVDVQEAYGLIEHSCITLNCGSLGRDNPTARKNTVGLILPNFMWQH